MLGALAAAARVATLPELPDVVVYVERLRAFTVGRAPTAIRVLGPSLVKTWDPPLKALVGKRIDGVERLGKRLVFAFEDDLFAVLHLMIAGRLRWRAPGAKLVRRRGLAAVDFGDHGTLLLTEAGTKKRAALHVVRGRDALSAFDRGGLDVLGCTDAEFAARLTAENRTLKRRLTDPAAFDGIGNAYSDEILHRAGLSPLQRTGNLDDAGVARLRAACRDVLTEWTDRLRAGVGEGFPEKVTAFRPEMAVHGKRGEPCPVCETKVAHVVTGEREWNYCPRCQTGGRVLRDRVLSRLLKDGWPPAQDD